MFRAFANSHRGPVIDTYDTAGGVITAARVLHELRRGSGCAIRLYSGDLGVLARQSRGILDGAGLSDVAIIASGGLDEYHTETWATPAHPSTRTRSVPLPMPRISTRRTNWWSTTDGRRCSCPQPRSQHPAASRSSATPAPQM